jgi:glutathione S-transferase
VFRTADARLVDPQLKAHMAFWDAELAKSEWFAGNDFTAADIMMSFPLEAAAQRAGAKEKPKLKAFLDKIHARPAYQAALKTGGQYDLIG